MFYLHVKCLLPGNYAEGKLYSDLFVLKRLKAVRQNMLNRYILQSINIYGNMYILKNILISFILIFLDKNNAEIA